MQKAQLDSDNPVAIGWERQVKEFSEEIFYGEIGEYSHHHILQWKIFGICILRFKLMGIFFGGITGIAGLLLQSHDGYIPPLPSLPQNWNEGMYSGLIAEATLTAIHKLPIS